MYSVYIVTMVGGIGILALLTEALRYGRELGAVKYAMKILGSAGGTIDGFYASIFQNPGQLSRKSFVFKRLESLWHLRESKCVPPWEELAFLDRQEADTGWACRLGKAAMSCLLILGICLTFLGLTSALRQSGANGFEDGSDEAKQIEHVVNVLVKGFQSSFSTSTAAIGWTIACLCLQIMVVSPLRERFFHKLESLMQLRLAPLMARESVLTPPDQVLASVALRLDAVCVELRISTETLAKTLHITQKANENLANFGTQFFQAIQAFENAIGGNSQFVCSIVELQTLLSRADARHSEVILGTREMIGEVRSQNITLAAQQGTLAEFMMQVKKSETHLRDGVAELLKAAAEVTARFHSETSKAVENACRKLASSLDALNTGFSLAEGGFARLKEGVDGLHAAVTSVGKSVDTSKTKALASWRGLGQQIKTVAEAVDRGSQDVGETRLSLEAGMAQWVNMPPLMAAMMQVLLKLEKKLETLPVDAAVAPIVASLSEISKLAIPEQPATASSHQAGTVISSAPHAGSREGF